MAVAVFSFAWPALITAAVWLAFHLLLCREIGRIHKPTSRRVVASAVWNQVAVAVAGGVGAVLGRPAEVFGVTIGAATAAHLLPALVPA